MIILENWMYEAAKHINEWNINEEKRLNQLDSNLTIASIDDLLYADPEKILSIRFEWLPENNDNTFIYKLSKFHNISSLSFSSNIEQNINADTLNYILNLFPAITHLSIYATIEWNIVKSINLANITNLSVTIADEISSWITAPNLVDMKLFCSFFNYCTELEILSTNKHIFDFSTTPKLINLELRHCLNINYISLRGLSQLNKLIIDDKSLTTLEWLSDSYQLKYLAVFGKIETINGIKTQPELEHLDLSYNYIQSIEELKEHSHLTFIDMRRNPLKDKFSPQSTKCTLIITPEDQKRKTILWYASIANLVNEACAIIKFRNNWNEKKTPTFVYRKWSESTYTEKFKFAVQIAFERNYDKILNNNKNYSDKYTEAHKTLYIVTAMKHFPFLKLSDTMKETYTK